MHPAKEGYSIIFTAYKLFHPTQVALLIDEGVDVWRDETNIKFISMFIARASNLNMSTSTNTPASFKHSIDYAFMHVLRPCLHYFACSKPFVKRLSSNSPGTGIVIACNHILRET